MSRKFVVLTQWAFALLMVFVFLGYVISLPARHLTTTGPIDSSFSSMVQRDLGIDIAASKVIAFEEESGGSGSTRHWAIVLQQHSGFSLTRERWFPDPEGRSVMYTFSDTARFELASKFVLASKTLPNRHYTLKRIFDHNAYFLEIRLDIAPH